MQYHSYQEKIKKIVAFLAKVYSFRVVIILAVLVLTLAATAAGVAKGAVFINGKCPETVEYGEALKYKSYAVLDKTQYEYCKEGSKEWTAEAPTEVGKYSVRSYAEDFFGNKRYGKIQSFEIKPKELLLKVSSSEVVYGEAPVLKADLEYGEKLECELVYDDLTASKTDVAVDEQSVRITNEKGEDTISNYSITVEAVEIQIKKRPLKIVVEGANKVYDNKPLLNIEGWEIQDSTLAFDDMMTAIKPYPSITDAGTISNSLVFMITNDGVDMTHQYNITVTEGELTVDKKLVYLTSATDSAVYDGEQFFNEEFAFDNAEDRAFFTNNRHEIIVADRTALTDATEEPVENVLAFEVIDEYGEYVTDNYSFVLTAGTLMLEKREITYISETIHEPIVYDGMEHGFSGFEVENIVGGHRAEPGYVEYFIDAGEYENIHEDIRIFNQYNEDVTHNYAITPENGTVVIDKRPIELVAANGTWEYDGEAHTDNSVSAQGKEGEPESGLVFMHTLEAQTEGSVTNVFDGIDGKVKNVISSYTIFDETGEDVTANYQVGTTDGELWVTPRSITVTANSNRWAYDREEHTDFGFEADRLVEGQIIKAEFSEDSRITDVGTKENVIESIRIYSDETESFETTRNYEILTVAGTLEVVKRTIKIKSESSSFMYDGSYHTYEKYTVIDLTGADLLSGDKIVMSNWAKVSDVKDTSEGNNTFDAEIVNSDGRPVDYYEIEPEYGTLTVTPRPIKLVAASTTWEYDGSTHTDDSVKWEAIDGVGGLVDGHTVSISVDGSITNVFDNSGNGVPNNITSWEIRDARGKLMADFGDLLELDNYTAETEAGLLTLTPKPIAFTVKDSYTRVYTGVNPQFSVKDDVRLVDSLVSGYELKAVNATGVDCDGSASESKYALKIITEEIEVANSKDTEDSVNYASNYLFSCKNSPSLEITKRPITVTSAGETLVYNGSEQSHEQYSSTELDLDANVGLLVGDELVFANWAVFKNWGTYQNTFDVTIEKDGRDISQNYDITPVFGEVTVSKRPLTITSDSQTWTYDGEAHSCPTFTTDGLVEGHTYEGIEAIGEITDLGTVLNTVVGSVVILDENNEEVTDNYSVSVKLGELKVIPPKTEITVYLQSDLSNSYNGTAQSYDSAYASITSGTLVSGHTIRYSISLDTAGKLLRDEIVLGKHIKIMNGEEDVTEAYDITLECEADTVFEVTPRSMSLTLRKKTNAVYDGNLHIYTNYRVQRLLSGHKLVFTGDNTNENGQIALTDAGTLTVSNISYDIIDSEGVSVKSSYTVNVSTPNGETLFVLSKRAVSISIQADIGNIYNGEEQAYKGEIQVDASTPLVLGHSISIPQISSKKVTQIYLDDLNIDITDGEKSVKHNYEITYAVIGASEEAEQLVFEIKSKDLTLTFYPMSVTYNGKEQSYNEAYCKKVGILDGHIIDLSDIKLTDAGNITIQTFRDNFYILDENGERVDQNYKVWFDDKYGNDIFVVKPKTIVIKSATVVREYDGKPYTNASAEIMQGGLLDGDKYEVTNATEVYGAGIYENVISIKIVDASGRIQYDEEGSSSNNYSVTYIYGTITITESN